MGTRADFYVGKGKSAVLNAHSEAEFRAAVNIFFSSRDDVTCPEQGWPWPWATSATSDCSYWFFDGRAWDASSEHYDSGDVYLPCDETEPDWDADEDARAAWYAGREKIDFPEMDDSNFARSGSRSGLIVISSGPLGIKVE